jgi:hypothetical protein
MHRPFRFDRDAYDTAGSFRYFTEVFQLHLWVPETRSTPCGLLLRRRRRPGMIPRWRCG